MSDIRKQIGLDFLRSRDASQGQDRRASERVSRNLEGALVAHGGPVLEAIRRVQPEPARLHAIVEDLRIPIDVAIRVVDYLEQQNYVEVVNRQLNGNHELRLTPEGVALLAR
jgi:hypothetical protein